jgi:hypothetical protein
MLKSSGFIAESALQLYNDVKVDRYRSSLCVYFMLISSRPVLLCLQGVLQQTLKVDRNSSR